MEELWKPIPLYQDLYEASNLGNVRSIRFRNRVADFQRYKVLKKATDKDGYLKVSMYGKWARQVGRLVGMAWIPNPENKPHINHIDGDKANNRVENLEWVTVGENHAHAFRLGLRRARLARLTPEQVREIRIMISDGQETQRAIAKKFGVHEVVVSAIKLRKIHRNVL